MAWEGRGIARHGGWGADGGGGGQGSWARASGGRQRDYSGDAVWGCLSRFPSQGLGAPLWLGRPTAPCPAGPHVLPVSLQSSLMDLADVFTAPAPPPASDPWGGPVPVTAAIPAAAPASDPWGAPPVPPAADPWGGPAPTPASGDPWRPAAPAGPPVDPWGGTQAPAAGEGPMPDPWGNSDGECWLPCPSSHRLPGHAPGWGQTQPGDGRQLWGPVP